MFQVRSITVNIGPQEKSHPSKVNLKSDAQKAKACCWLDMVSVEKNGWSVGVVLSSWCTKLAPQNHPLFSWAILEVEERKPLPLTKRQVFNTNLKGMFLSGTGFDIREQKANNCLFRNQAWCSFFLPYHIKSGGPMERQYIFYYIFSVYYILYTPWLSLSSSKQSFNWLGARQSSLNLGTKLSSAPC